MANYLDGLHLNMFRDSSRGSKAPGGRRKKENPKAQKQAVNNAKKAVKTVKKTVSGSAKTSSHSSYTGGGTAVHRSGGSNKPAAQRNTRNNQARTSAAKKARENAGSALKTTVERTQARAGQQASRSGKADTRPVETGGRRMSKGASEIAHDTNYVGAAGRAIEGFAGGVMQAVGGYMKFAGKDYGSTSERMGMSLDWLHDNGKLSDDEYTKAKEGLESSKAKKVEAAQEKSPIVKGISKGREKVFEGGEKLSERGDWHVTQGGKGLEGFAKNLYDADVAAGGMTVDAATRLGLVSMFARSYGSELGKAEKEGATPAEDWSHALLQGSKEAAGERLFNVAGLPAKAFGKGVADDILLRGIEKLTGKIASKSGNKIITGLAEGSMKTLAAAGGEFIEESLQQAVEPSISNITYANRVGKTKRKEIGGSIQSEITDIDKRINALVSQGYDEQEIRQAYLAGIDDEYIDAVAQSYIEAGVGEKKAYAIAHKMARYMRKSIAGDKTAEKAKEKLIQEIYSLNPAEKETKISDILSAGVSGAILGGVTGGAGQISAASDANSIREAYGKSGITKMIRMAMHVDDDAAVARIANIKEAAENGQELSMGQVNAVYNAVQRQQAKDERTYQKYLNTAKEQRIKENSTQDIFTVQINEQGEPQVQLNDIARDKYEDALSAAKEVANTVLHSASFTEKQEFSTDDEAAANNEELNEIAASVAAVVTGVAVPDDVNTILSSSEGRAVYEEVTGKKLSKSSAEAREALFAANAANNVRTAKEETNHFNDRVKGLIIQDVSENLNTEGLIAFSELMRTSEDIDGTDINTIAGKYTTFEDYYRAGRSGISFEEVSQTGNPYHSSLGMEMKHAAYEAGVADKAEYVPGSGRGQVSIGQKITLTQGTRQGRLISELTAEAKSRFTASEQRMYQMLAQSLGVNIHIINNESIVETDENGNQQSIDANGTNGFIANGEIYLNIDAERNLEYVFAHEITHWMQVMVPDKYNDLRNLLIERWQENDPEGMEKAIADKIELYNKAGKPLDRDKAIDEIIADSTVEMLNDEEFVDDICESRPDVAQAVLGAIRNLLAKIRVILANAGGFIPRHNVELLSNLDILKEMEQLWAEGIWAAAQEKVGSESNEPIYSIAYTDKNEPVAIIDEDILEGVPNEKQLTTVSDAILDMRPGIPISGRLVGITRKSSGHFINSGYTNFLRAKDAETYNDKLKTASNVADVVYASTDYVNEEPLHDREDNIVQFARGTVLMRIGENDYQASVIVGYTDQKTLLFYDVQDLKPTSFKLKEKRYSLRWQDESKTSMITVPLYEDSISEIGQIDNNYLQDSDGNELSEGQVEFFEDSKVRDEDGNLLVMYHGTPSGNFTVFRDGSYFTANPNYAERYKGTSASSIKSGKTENNPKIYKVYLNIKKPFDIKDPEARDIYINEYAKGGNAVGINPYEQDSYYENIDTIDWTEGEDLRDFLIEEGYDYDGLVLDEGADGGYGEEVQSRGYSYVTFSPEQVKDVLNTNPTNNPDIQFSIKEPVEAAGDLIAVHNLNADNLKKSLELGGFPMPSIAIVRDNMLHDKYGDISLLFGSETIDPARRDNEVYGGDAWTPTIGMARIDYEADRKSTEHTIEKINAIRNDNEELKNALYSYSYYEGLNGLIDQCRGVDGLIQRLLDDVSWKQAYLSTKGEFVPKFITSDEKTIDDTSAKIYDTILSELGDEFINEWEDTAPGADKIKFVSEHADAIKNAVAKAYAAAGVASEEDMLESLEGKKPGFIFRDVREALKYRKNGKTTVTTKEDTEARNEAVNSKVNQNEYRAWLEDLFSGIKVDVGVWNGKDYLTDNGRRTFKQLHNPVTLENIVKAMKLNKNGETFMGLALKAIAQKQFKSISEIRNDKERLTIEDEEKFQEQMEEFGEREAAIVNRIYDRDPHNDYDNPFIKRGYIRDTIADTVRTAKTGSDMLEELQQYYDVTKQDVDDIVELVNDVANMPTGYFEAKPRRAVSIDEIKAAVVPEGTDTDIVNALKDNGVEVTTYSEDNRLEAVNEAANNAEIKFSVSEDTGNSEPTPEPVDMDAILDEFNRNDEIFDYIYDPQPYAEPGKRVRTETVAELRDKVEKLKADKRLTHGKVLDTKPIRKDIINLLQSMASISHEAGSPVLGLNGRLSKDNLRLVDSTVKNAKHIYKLMKNGHTQEAVLTVMNVADDIVESIQIIDDSTYDDYKELVNYLKQNPMTLSEEDRANIPDFKEFKMIYRGQLRIVNEGGRPVDTVYEELVEMFPGMFDPEITHPADQLVEIADVRDKFAPYDVMLTAEEREHLLRDTAGELMDIIAEGEPWQSFADKKQKQYQTKVKLLRERHKEALRDLKIQERERAELKIAEAKEKGEAKLQKAKERAAKREAQLKQQAQEKDAKRKEAKERAKAFGSIEKNYTWLSDRLIKASDDKHIPEQYKICVAELLQALDLQTERSKKLEEVTGHKAQKTFKFEELRRAYKEIANEDGSGEFEYDAGIVEMLEQSLCKKLEGKSIDALDTQTMQEIDVLLKAIVGNIRNANKAFTDELNATLDEMRNNVISGCDDVVKKSGTFAQRRGAGHYIFEKNGIINMSMKKPREFFEHIGGSLLDSYMAIRHGQDKHVKNMEYLRNQFSEMFAPFNKSSRNGKKIKPGSEIESWRDSSQMMEFKLESGETIQLNPAQMMSLYCLSKREQALSHILGSGVVASKVRDKFGKIIKRTTEIEGSKVYMSLGDVTTILKSLTPEQIKLADQMQALLNGEIAKWGNETSMKMYNYNKFTEQNYFPIKCDDAYLNSNFEGRTAEERIRNFGFTKGTITGANNPIVIADIFEVVADHCNKMSLYNAFAAPLADFTRIFNGKVRDSEGMLATSVKDMIVKAYGKDAQQYIHNLMSDINGQVQLRPDPIERFMTKSLANYKKATIGANLRVAIQQPTAIVRAFDIIDPKYFVGMNKSHVVKNAKEMIAHCPIAMWKSWGHNDIDLARDIDDIMMNNDWSKWDMATMGIYGALDVGTWGIIWSAVKKETKAIHPELKEGTEEFWHHCSERASEIYDKTQVVDSVFHRSQVMRRKDVLSKMMTSFMAEPTTTFNMLLSDIVEARDLWSEGKRTAANKKLGRCVTVFVANAAAVSAAAALVDLFRDKLPWGDDDDDKEGFEQWWANFMANFCDNINPVKMIPLIKDIWDLKDGWGTQNMALEGWNKLIKNMQDWYEYAFGDSNSDLSELLLDTFDAIGYVTGVPTPSIRRDVTALFKRLGIEVSAADGSDDEEKIELNLTDKFFSLFGIEDGSKTDNFLNKFGINLSEEEKAEKEFQENKKDILKKIDGLKGKDKQDKLWREITCGDKSEGKQGLKTLCEEGKIKQIEQMRKLYKACGGDVDKFDEELFKKLKTSYKKTIGEDDKADVQNRIYDYFISSGMTEKDISEIVKDSDIRKEFQRAWAEGDESKGIPLLQSMRDAGITYEDYEWCCNNAYRVVHASDYATGELQWPTNGMVTSGFGRRNSPTAGASSYHQAIDIGASYGSGVVAADGGKVVFSGWNGGYGKQVVIDHGNGCKTYYSHLSWYDEKAIKGNVVKKGQKIGNVGSTGTSTGPHLDFKYQVNGKYVDPREYMPKR